MHDFISEADIRSCVGKAGLALFQILRIRYYIQYTIPLLLGTGAFPTTEPTIVPYVPVANE